MAVELRPRTALAVLLVVLALGAAGTAAVATVADGERYDPDDDRVVVAGAETGDPTELWPYTSRARTHESRTLAINLVVYGDVEATEHHLRESARGDWNETAGDFEDDGLSEGYTAENGTATAWGTADGSTRFVQVTEADGTDHWLTESYQLHDGDYLGTRHHVRAYAAPDADEEWTALQGHREHWDWFRLRHTVDSIEESQRYVEAEFMGHWFVDDVWRTYVGNDEGSDSDGWMTVVELGPAGTEDVPGEEVATLSRGTHPSTADYPADRSTGLSAWSIVLVPFVALGAIGATRVTAVRRRVDESIGADGRRVAALVAGPIALLLAVRFAAIGVERTLPLPPRAIAAVLYPFVFAGLPVAVYLLARQLDRVLAFTGASVGFVAAVLFDYTYAGVGVLPLDVLIHRVTLAVALGFIAIGASRPERLAPEASEHLRMGVLLWLVALVLPLIRFV